MRSLPLDKFPLIVLEGICAELAQLDANKATLFTFSRASKCCCQAARRYRFESVTLNINPNFDLDVVVKECSAILQRNDAFGCVRNLTVRNNPLPYLLHRYGSNFLLELGHAEMEFALGRVCFAGLNGGPGLKPLAFDSSMYPSGFTHHKEVPSSNRVPENWESLVNMLLRVPMLTDFTFDMDHRLPRPILVALQSYLPRTNLHMASFWLSNDELTTDSEVIEGLKMNPIFSPCLKSMFAHNTFGRNGANFIFEIVRDMILHTAPKLEHLWICDDLFSFYPNARDGIQRLKAMSLQLALASSLQFLECAKLAELHLDGKDIGGDCLTLCSEVIDFSVLRYLSIRQLDREAARVLGSMATGGLFTSLQGLSLSGNFHGTTLKTFLAAIRPLSSLALHGLSSPKALSAIEIHGNRLRHLRLHLSNDLENVLQQTILIQQLQLYAPHLESLEIQAFRWRESRDEADFYRTIGHYTRLRRVVLELYYNKKHPTILADWEPLIFKNSLARAAVDEELVRSIFEAISSTQAHLNSKKQGLQFLKLLPRSGYHDHIGPFNRCKPRCKVENAVLKSIARPWICETSWSENMRDGISTRPAHALDVDWQKLRDAAKEFPCIGETWKELWPYEDEQLFENWSSFALGDR